MTLSSRTGSGRTPRFSSISQRRQAIHYITHPDGHSERLVHAFQLRYLFRFEAEHLLARSGFEVEQLYAGVDKSAYGSQYPGDLVFVARKTTRVPDLNDVVAGGRKDEGR